MSATTTSVRVRRRQQTRQEILAAAWRLAERDGIASLALRDLAAEVGMRAPSLYTYFEGKAAIYDAMFAEGYGQLDATLEGTVLDADDPVTTLTRAITTYLDFCRASIPRYQLMFTRVVPDWEPSSDAYAVSVASYERTAAQLRRVGIRRERDLDLFTAVTSGLAAQQLANDPDGDRWVGLSADVAQMVHQHITRSA
jgi:AcrR family transcriptional regulator